MLNTNCCKVKLKASGASHLESCAASHFTSFLLISEQMLIWSVINVSLQLVLYSIWIDLKLPKTSAVSHFYCRYLFLLHLVNTEEQVTRYEILICPNQLLILSFILLCDAVSLLFLKMSCFSVWFLVNESDLQWLHWCTELTEILKSIYTFVNASVIKII